MITSNPPPIFKSRFEYLRNTFALPTKNAIRKKGMAKPNEYPVTLIKVSIVFGLLKFAYMIVPNIGPIHGVHPAAKMMPTNIELNTPILPFLNENLFSCIINFGWNMPNKNNPIAHTKIPPSILIRSLYSVKNFPIELAENPNM